MNVEVNWLAVVLATLFAMVVGSIWYAKPVFGRTWMKLIGKTDEDIAKGGWSPIVITVIVSFITAYVLAHVIFLSHEFFQNSLLQDAVSTAFWLWLGLVAARIITHDAFEGRRKKLTLLTITHELVTLMVMAVIIGLLPA